MISRMPLLRTPYWGWLGLKRILTGTLHTCEMDITSACNLECRHCYSRAEMRSESGVKSDAGIEEWERRMRLLQRRGIRKVLMAGGEPSLRLDVLSLADRIFPVLMVITNGMVRIPESFRHVLFVSLDGLERSNDSMRGEGVFGAVLGNYRNDRRVIVNMTLHKDNYTELEQVVELSMRNGWSGCSCNIFCDSRDSSRYDDYLPGNTREKIVAELRRVSMKYPAHLLFTPSMIRWFELPDHSSKCYWRGNVLHFDSPFSQRTCFTQNPDCSRCGCYAGAFSSLASKPLEFSLFAAKTALNALSSSLARKTAICLLMLATLAIPNMLQASGKELPLNDLKAFAEAGNARAQVALGNAYFQGLGAERDYVKAFQWYRKAFENGSRAASFNLGICYENGLGTLPDKLKAFEMYSMAADSGIPEAAFNVALSYRNGIVDPREGEVLAPDMKKAEQMLEALKKQGFFPAYRALAEIYLKRGDETLFPEAFRMLSLAAARGDAQAMNLLADCYSGGWGVERSPTERITWLERAASAGSMEACAKLAYCYERGDGVRQDPAKALRLYAEAAASGLPMAQVKLAEAYAFGIGVNQDLLHARKLFEKAASAGDARAIFSLGLFALQGTGEEPNEKKAAALFLAAANLGDTHAQFNVGNFYMQGRGGLPQDPGEAFRWFLQAAQAGSPRAQRELAFCFLNGTGTAADFEQGMKWLRQAVHNGDVPAKEFLDDVLPVRPPEGQ